MASNDTTFSSLTEEVQYIIDGAKQRGLDPWAVLAVARAEGLGAGAGDHNTSFGPFQLHIGGKLPASVAQSGVQSAQQWANSPQGIDYALNGIADVAKGLSGGSAISAIVSRFEHPTNVSGEVSRAQGLYTNVLNQPASSIAKQAGGYLLVYNDGGVWAPGPPIRWGGVFGKGAQAGGGVGAKTAGAGAAAVDWVSSLTNWIKEYSIRAAEVVGGFFLLLIGFYLLARQVGLATNPPGPVGNAVGAVS